MLYKCLSIAGFDGSGGAGIQADLKTFSALGCYGMTILTALPVQNTQGVKSCYDIPLKAIQEQLESIFDDIVPNSIKIGMLFSGEIIELVADFLRKHARMIPIVIDPVMFAKSGDPLLLPEAVDVLKATLLPLATIVTPNLPEAQTLIGSNSTDPYKLGEQILNLGPQAVLVKGGHSQSTSSDDLFLGQSGQLEWLQAPRITSNNTHGTGCTLSSAICALLAQNLPLFKACGVAKQYLSGAILAAQHQSVGHGNGPLNHFYQLWQEGTPFKILVE